MRMRFALAGSLCCLAATVVPAHAQQPAPRTGYIFAHGAASHFRNWVLATDITNEDVSDPSNNGTFKIGFQARMPEFVVRGFPDGSGIIDTTFDQISTNVNGSPVTGAVPDAIDLKGVAHRYLLLVNPDGTCNCSRLPPLYYDGSGGYGHSVPLGAVLEYLHPSLPRSAMKPNASWTSSMPVGISALHSAHATMHSHLHYSGGLWTVVSSMSQTIAVTISAREYLALYPHDTLTSNAPVTVTGFIKVSSSLTLMATDGIGVVPFNAKHGSKAAPCATCTGYPLPLRGTLSFHKLYSQNGAELSRSNWDANLTIAASQ